MTIGLLLSGAKKVFIRYTAYLPLLFLLGICFPILFGDRTGAENLRFTNIGEGRMWEVHLGDFAPVQGRPVPDPDAEWLPFDDRVTPSPPVPRQYEGMYWMRIPIPQLGGIQDPQLFIRGYKHIQLFVESRLIYEFNMEHPDPKVNKFIHW
ncbi:MAG: response regulator, partial [Paenibacillus sp.]|nr:response regulator [Paenibacillus sp.]